MVGQGGHATCSSRSGTRATSDAGETGRVRDLIAQPVS
jgi:hypothetical protein